MNESGFFFGNSDVYVTYPNMQRDRRVLSYSEHHSRGLGFLDKMSVPDESDEASKMGPIDDETDLAFFQLQNRVHHEDDILLSSQPSPTLGTPE